MDFCLQKSMPELWKIIKFYVMVRGPHVSSNAFRDADQTDKGQQNYARILLPKKN